MNIIEKNSKYLVENNGRFCQFSKLKNAESMLAMIKLIDCNAIPEISLVDIENDQFSVKYNREYLFNLKKWMSKHTRNASDFYEDEDCNINFVMNNRTVSMSPFSVDFMVSHKDDYEFEQGREISFKAPRSEKDFIRLKHQIPSFS